jgi:transposase InsO family protein
VDCYSRAIVGWHAATVKDTAMVHHRGEDGIVAPRSRQGRVDDGLIHHGDARSQYMCIAFAETLVLEGIAASIGSIGDA